MWDTLLKLKDISGILWIKEKLQFREQAKSRAVRCVLKVKYIEEKFPSTTSLCINLTYFCEEQFFIII